MATAPEANKFSVDLEKGEAPPAGFVRGRTVVLACAVMVVGILGLNIFSTFAGNKRDTRREADAAAMWSAKTAHTFVNTSDGIVETFAATDPADVKRSIRFVGPVPNCC